MAVATLVVYVGGLGVLKANRSHQPVAAGPAAARLALAQIGSAGKPAQKLPAQKKAAAPPARTSKPGGKPASTLTPAPSPAPVPPSASAAGTHPDQPAVVVAAPKPNPAPDTLVAYRGLGAWVDWYDYGHPDSMDPAAIVDELAKQGVRTLYLETGLWAKGPDILNPGVMNVFVEHAHAKGIHVVGWYVPGFADIDHDVRASLAVLTYTTPGGQHFDGFAPDIEDRQAIVDAGRQTVTINVPWHRGCGRTCTATTVVDASAVDVLARFDSAVTDYSRRLRRAVPAGTVLGAIVPDALNNERSPYYWTGFPWPDMAANYDVVLPMAYWSVSKPADCPATDASGYIKNVVTKTTALMGISKPIHPIGGVSDCLKIQDVTTYVDATTAAGSIGGSLYDFLTTNANPERDAFWATLRRLNG